MGHFHSGVDKLRIYDEGSCPIGCNNTDLWMLCTNGRARG